MQGPPTPLSVLSPQAEAERQRIRQQFEAGASARETLRALCELADRNVQRVFGELLHVHESAPQGLAQRRDLMDVQQFSENPLNVPVRERAQRAQRFSRDRKS